MMCTDGDGRNRGRMGSSKRGVEGTERSRICIDGRTWWVSALGVFFVACCATPPEVREQPAVSQAPEVRKDHHRAGETKQVSGFPVDKAAAETASPGIAASPVRDATRVVAVGDLHGDLNAARAALQVAGVLGDDGRWAGGPTILVQTGDVLDRGDDEPEILQLLEDLQTQAPAYGGRVELLLGNHEYMNAMGDLRYVTPGGFDDYAKTPVPPELAAATPEAAAPVRARFAAFRPGSSLAKRLATRKVAVKVGRSVFVHGGISPSYAKQGIETINQQSEAWFLNGGPPLSFVNDSDGPVWSRQFSDKPDSNDCAQLKESLEILGVDRMVVGHTVHLEGIRSDCDGRIWTIDVGMARHYGGRPAALEIIGDEIRVLSESDTHADREHESAGM